MFSIVALLFVDLAVHALGLSRLCDILMQQCLAPRSAIACSAQGAHFDELRIQFLQLFVKPIAHINQTSP